MSNPKTNSEVLNTFSKLKEQFQDIKQNLENNGLKSLEARITELETAIRIHQSKVSLVQQEDLDLWAHLSENK